MSDFDAKFMQDEDLRNLLRQWNAPDVHGSLDNRVAATYQQMMSDPAALSNSTVHSQRDSEVVVMKFCSACHEQFAERFSFCPVDGTPLEAPSTTAANETGLGGVCGMKNLTVKTETEDLILERLKELLSRVEVPSAPPSLDVRVSNSWDQEMSQRQARREAADIQLRKLVVISLVGVFTFSVCLTALIIFLIGLGWIKLPPEVIYILLASTIAEGVVLYRQVIAYLFGQAKSVPSKTRPRAGRPTPAHTITLRAQPEAR